MIKVNAKAAEVQAALVGNRCTSLIAGMSAGEWTGVFEASAGTRVFHPEVKGGPAVVALETGGAIVEAIAPGPSPNTWALVLKTA